MHQESSPCAPSTSRPSGARLSYKFQRLREQIREAIVRGEFGEQLPGERELGRRFRANAKTINKALCDLAGEGLLVRIIGRGTFVAETPGVSAAARTSQVYHGICPAMQNEPPHRGAIISALRDALAAMGHRLDLIPHEGDGDGEISSAAWPAHMRRLAAGLIAHPAAPLDGRGPRPGDALVAEAWRRHLPIVLLGAAASNAKVNAVMPDYISAGFRLAEHLFLLGCGRMVVLRDRAEGREADMVTSGCQTAAIRHRGSVTEVFLERQTDWVGGLMGDGLSAAADKSRVSPGVGIVCVGSRALEAAQHDRTINELVARDSLAVACVLEPGDDAAQRAGVTSMEFDAGKIAGWAARLLAEWKPGQRPVEVLVPGEIKVRGRCATHRNGNGHGKGRHGDAESLEGLGGRQKLAEAVI